MQTAARVKKNNGHGRVYTSISEPIITQWNSLPAIPSPSLAPMLRNQAGASPLGQTGQGGVWAGRDGNAPGGELSIATTRIESFGSRM